MKVTISGITLKDEKTIDKWALQDLDEVIEMNR